MISRRRLAALVLVPTALFLIEVSCNHVPLTAPSGSSITLTSATSVMPVGGTATIIAQVIEAAGTPPQSGTHVTFSTSLGTIQPSEATTNASGQATATFTSTSSGTATITAISGGASVGANALKILVGSAAVQKVVVNASPATVPALGGSTTISATVFDVNGNLMTGTPVTFTTTAGTLSSGVVNTGDGGVASTTLTTAQTATVTASVGVGNSSTTPPSTTTPPTTGTPTTPTTPTTPSAAGQASASVTVNIAAAPTIVITPPSTPPTAGVSSTFTFAITVPSTNGSAIKNLNVDWGDGSAQDLGAVTGSAVVAHTFASANTYLVTATATDASGNVVKVSTVVFVQAAPPLGVTITFTKTTVDSNNTLASFTATVTGLGNAVVNQYLWDFGDNTTKQTTTTNQVTHNYTHPSSPPTLKVTVTVTPSSGSSVDGTTQITP